MQNDNTIQQIRIHTKDYLEFLGAKMKGRYYHCVFHTDNTPSAILFEDSKRFKCLSCGEHGDIIDLCMHIEKKSFAEALEYLANRYGIEIDLTRYRSFDNKKEVDIPKEILRKTAEILRENINEDFLKQRHLSISEARQNYIGSISTKKLLEVLKANKFTEEQLLESGVAAMKTVSSHKVFRMAPTFGERMLTFSLKDINGDVIGFAGRDMYYKKGNPTPKYYNTATTKYFNKNGFMYNMNEAIMESKHTGSITVTEGYNDVLSMKRIGIKDTVAICGTSLTENHIKILKEIDVKRINLCLDSDQAGIDSTMKHIEKFLKDKDITLVFTILPHKMDPDDIITKEGADAFNSITPISTIEYLIRYSPKLNRLTQEEKLAEQCQIIKSNCDDLLSTNIYSKLVADLHEVPVNLVYKMMK
jgi:DNA primase